MNAELTTLAEAPTAAISDALDMAGLPGVLSGFSPVRPGTRCLGPAYTVRYEPVPPGGSGPAGDYVDEIPPGAVAVVDNRGRRDCTVWGDLLSLTALRRDLSGTVVHGACRDADGIAALGYPVFALGVHCRSGKNRVRLTARQVPVPIDDVVVSPGDVVRADDSGVTVIPRAHLAEVADRVALILTTERAIADDVSAGLSLARSRRRHRYNELGLARIDAPARSDVPRPHERRQR